MTAVRRAFLILLILAGLVAFALVWARDPQTLRIRTLVDAHDVRFPQYTAALLGTTLTVGNRYEVLTNGDRFYPSMLAAIKGARERIKFETYVLTPGQIARQFTEALEAAVRRGVRVIVIVDAVGSTTRPNADVKRLADAGCEVVRFNVPRWYSLKNINYRTHRKILTVDGEIGFTGGAGIDDQWLGNAQNPDHWRDTMVSMEGPVVRLLEAAFYENYMETGAIVTPAVEDYPPVRPAETSPSLLVQSNATGGSSDLKRLYLLSIAAARRTVDIVSPYFVPDGSSMWALEDAAKRGVKIRILSEGDVTDAAPVKYASRSHYEKLLAMGIEVFEYQPTMMHTKVLVVDGVWSVFGSANFDNRSMELNDELNIAVWDRQLAARFLEDLTKDLQLSRRVQLETWRQRRFVEKRREQFWAWFAEVF
jgi:cardiolipin synthase A/B